MTTLVATDIVTFYHNGFWGLAPDDNLAAWVEGNVEKFWEKVLGVLVETGVTGIELTFAPGNIENVIRGFGSARAFRAELEARGLKVVSAFMADAPAWSADAEIGAIVADAERRAAFIVEAGGNLLVTGLPMRRTFGTKPALVVDAQFMGQMADIAHAIGEAVAQQGVGLAIHTESNSALWYERDIDLFMGFTDPRYVGLCPDSCHITLGGGDPVRVAERYNQRISLAHWKDAIRPIDVNMVIDHTIYAQQQRYMADFGAGIVDWTGWSAAMLKTPGKDIVLLELDAAADPAAALRSGRAVLGKVRA